MHYQEPPSLLTPLQALFVLVLVFAVPVLLLNPVFDINSLVNMILDSLGLGFLWTRAADDESLNYDRRRTKRKKLIRSRADQALSVSEGKTYKYYPGLVNISGTYCFLNSTLQAMASLSYLQPYLDNVHRKAEAVDVPTPVLDALVSQMHVLNQPSSRASSLRPTDIIHALETPVPGFKRGTLFASRQHQDAQELFQLISETLKEEALEVDKEASKDRGLSGLGAANQIYLHRPAREPGKGVFEGLTANRRSCVMCGYTEAVMHFAFDNLQLTVPRLAQCRLEDCLEEYTRMEILNDCICRKCSMNATLRKLEADVIRLSTSDGPETVSRKKKIGTAQKLVRRVKSALEEGRIEEDIKGVTLEKVISRSSTKQTMLARTPPVLALHLNRSAFYGHYASKNSCSVNFPEVLDLTPFTTSGALSIAPQAPISKPVAALPPRSSTPTPSVYSSPRVLYRLSSVVCHYGAHSFGHYVAYRRKPRDPSLHSSRWASPQLQCPYGCECEKCQMYGPIRDPDFGESSGRKGKGRSYDDDDVWLRISDDQVKEVGLNTVLSETTGSFMLYYEKVLPFQSDGARASPQSSQETVTPQDLRDEKRLRLEEMMDQSISARIIRSVSMGAPSREGSLNISLNGDIIKPNGYANGHSDPNHKSEVSEKESSHTHMNGTPELSVPPTSPPSIPLSASPVRSGHHLPRSPSPVRTVDLRA